MRSGLLFLFLAQKLVHCVKTVFILLSPEPSMLDVGRAALLLPYLKSATTVSHPFQRAGQLLMSK